MQKEQFLIRFLGVSDAEANQLSASLLTELNGIDRSVKVERIRLNPSAQDFGAGLAIILGSASVTAIARGVANWLARGNTVIEISKDGEVKASGLESKDAARIAEAFSDHR